MPDLQAPRSDYDVVVLGGGHNGLVAAAYLARAGRSCLALERRPRLGGATASEQLFAGHDARLSSYSYLVSLLPRRIVAELGLGLRLARRSVASYTPDPRVDGSLGLLLDDRHPDATRRSFIRVAGGEREWEAWSALRACTRRVASAVFPTLTEPLPSRAQLRARVPPADWEALFERPLGETLQRLFGDELVRGVALTDALIGTFSHAHDPELRQNRCFLYHVIGGCDGEWQVPVGGMGVLAESLAATARAAGAELRTGLEVLALEPSADGVEVRYGDGAAERRVRGRRLLAAVAPEELARLLGEDRQQGVRAEGAQLKVDMLLSRLPRLRERGIDPPTAFAGTFHVNETASQLQAAHERAAAGRIPSPVPCEAYCHSLTDPSILGRGLRDAGAQTLTVFALQMPARLFEADPQSARETALAATLASLDSVLAEPIAGCLLRDRDGRPCVEARSPVDLERELRMPGGHIFHRDLSWPFAEREEDVGRWGVETCHPAILLCGAGARRGGGVSGIPGRNAAMAVLASG